MYRISQKAAEDLKQIWVYTYYNWSERQADKYYDLIISKINFVSSKFESGRPIDYIKQGYRSYAVESHIIFYHKADDGIVEIIRVLHQNMNIPNRLID